MRYVGTFLMWCGSFAAFNVLQGWITSTVPSTRTKRPLTSALVNMMANLAHIYGVYFFRESDSPQLVQGGVALASFAFGGTCHCAWATATTL